MHQIYLILAAILIGTSIGSLLSKRNNLLKVCSLVAIALGVFTLFVPSWLPLVIGLVVLLAAQFMQRDPVATRS